MILSDFARAARGEGGVDLLLRHARIVDVHAGVVREGSVAVSDGVIVGCGEGYEAAHTVDLEGAYLCPGFIDGHVHLESSMVMPPEYARAVVPRGTTAVVTDFHEIANVLGTEGVRALMRAGEGLPLDIWVMAPSCVPATDLETAGARLEAAELLELRRDVRVIGLGEMMNFPGVVHGDPGVLAKLEAFRGAPIDGHAPGLSGRALAAYAGVGIGSDHECTTAEEAREKLAVGMRLAIRQGSTARNLAALLPVVTSANSRRCYFCTDDRHPEDLLMEGHMDQVLREAVASGLDPLIAIQMATCNAREFLGLEGGGVARGFAGTGVVAPGYVADLVVLESLEEFAVRQVYKRGVLVAEEGRLRSQKALELPEAVNTIKICWERAGDIAVPASRGRMRVIGLIPDQIVTEALAEEPAVAGGLVVSDTGRDLLKLCVFERHTGSGNVGIGFIRGLGMRSGAMASTVAHDSHNLVVAGVSDEDILAAARAVEAMGGGQAVVEAGEVRAKLALPMGGLMSTDPLESVAASVRSLQVAARGLGCGLRDPFMALAFMALPVIPALKLTDRGLFDVNEFRHVDLFL